MAEYIEREALEDALYENEFQTFCPLDEVVSVIDNIPAADVVEVVRCKDCEYRTVSIDLVGDAAYGCSHPYGLKGNPPDYGFCSYGERRAEE